MNRYSIIFRLLCTIAMLTFISCEDRDNPFAESDALVRVSGLSSCGGQITELSNDYSSNQLAVKVEDGLVLFTHSGAQFNCCVDSVTMQSYGDGNVIRIVETPHTAYPCRCTCPHTVQGEIVDLPAGNYTLEVASSASAEHSLCTADIRVE